MQVYLRQHYVKTQGIDSVGTSISAETISSITDRVLPELEAHQEAYLYDQYRGRLPSPDSQGDKEQGCFSERHCFDMRPFCWTV